LVQSGSVLGYLRVLLIYSSFALPYTYMVSSARDNSLSSSHVTKTQIRHFHTSWRHLTPCSLEFFPTCAKLECRYVQTLCRSLSMSPTN